MVRRDAISNVVQDCVRALSMGGPISGDLRIFVRTTDYVDPTIVIVKSVTDLLRNAHFRESDIVLWHFGVFYDLFDAMLACTARKVVYFHNVTPLDLFDGARSDVIRKSHQQIDNLDFADLVICNSAFTRDFLSTRGVTPGRIEVLPPATPERPRSEAAFDRVASGPELLYVGRFVPQKAVGDLLLALARVNANRRDAVQLTLVGSQRYSDPQYLEQLLSIIHTHKLENCVRFLGEVSQESLCAQYARAHALVIASRHEGFCVPVIEALSAGCYIICSDAGNLPFVCNGLGSIYPCGHIGKLAAAIGNFADRFKTAYDSRTYRTKDGELAVPEFERRAKDYAGQFTYDRFAQRLRALVVDGCDRPAMRCREPSAPREAFHESIPDLVSDLYSEHQKLADRLDQLQRFFAKRRALLAGARNMAELEGPLDGTG
jgi:glycosyltransferase involved in cell wall biosynthesis